MRLKQSFAELHGDVKFATRQMRRSPAFTLIALVTVALGIGANSAIFALVDATLLRPLPFPEPGRLVMIWERDAMSGRNSVAPLNLLDWSERNRTFHAMAGFIPGVGGMALVSTQGAPPEARSSYFLRAIGRLKRGVTLEAANADMAAVAEGLAREFPATNKGRGVTLQLMPNGSAWRWSKGHRALSASQGSLNVRHRSRKIGGRRRGLRTLSLGRPSEPDCDTYE